MEKLEFGQSSANNEVRYIAPHQFARTLKQMRLSQSGRGIFTRSPESRAGLYVYDINILHNLVFRFGGRYKMQDIVTVFQKQRETLARHQRIFGLAKYNEYMNFLNTLERTVLSIVEQYPKFDIDGLDFFYNPPGGTEIRRGIGMHSDEVAPAGFGDLSLAVVYTVVGPSTIYKAKDEHEIQLPEASMVGHISNGAEHRTPDYTGLHRLTIAIGFMPKRK